METTATTARPALAPNMVMDDAHALVLILEETGITSHQSIHDLTEMLALGQSISTPAARYVPTMRQGRPVNVVRRSR